MPETALGVRDHRLDAAKGVLIFLVVLGHLLEATSAWGAKSTQLPLTAIYMFHMPAFVFLAGVTSKATKLPRRIGTYLVLLATFQTLYFVAVHALALERSFSLLVPFWILWFLLAMMWWQLLTPITARFPRISVTVSIFVACTVGIFESIGYDLSLSRALVFLPFFVIGATYGPSILRIAGRIPLAGKLAGVAIVTLTWLYLYVQDIDRGWLYGSQSFARLDTALLQGVLVRAGLLGVAAVATIALLSWMPNKNGLLARLGRRSLAIFVLHGFVVLAVRPYLPAILDQTGAVLSFAVCLFLAALIVALFSRPVFDKTIRGYSQGVVELLLRPSVRSRTQEGDS